MLTDAAIRKIKPTDKSFKVADMHGLYLLVQPNGARYWRMDYRHAEKRGTVALGVYPDVSLKEAREKRANARKLLREGREPFQLQEIDPGRPPFRGRYIQRRLRMNGFRRRKPRVELPQRSSKLRWLLRVC